jgi:hypothetical protein
MSATVASATAKVLTPPVQSSATTGGVLLILLPFSVAVSREYTYLRAGTEGYTGPANLDVGDHDCLRQATENPGRPVVFIR